uniref:Uncharacterized protein n=1 Tax=Myoviridae sp. ctIty1 TaxID=2827673 RepID=A0A8S5TH01_9CAUD|nr:MAG TPA: hypothetical protein [Myoviridae sp. ctIty1]
MINILFSFIVSPDNYHNDYQEVNLILYTIIVYN